ncbi:MAG: efflux RND transporter permease subunit [Betaproteobacteria bacterium]|nr:efflux RND transporter permease subunit [Betaproteobacteria bacterium]
MGISGRITQFFLQSQLTPLIALVAFLLGLFAVAVTPREEEPQINVTVANVYIPFPGASAADVESLVATPAEQVVSQISGIEHVFSASRPGLAILTVQYKVGQDRIQALVRLYDTLSANRDWVPPELGVGDFIVKPMGIDDVPIVALTLWTDDPARGGYELQQVANAAEIELKRVAGTRTVTTIGGAGRMVRVLLDPERLNAYGIAVPELRRALAAANSALPAGKLTQNNREIMVDAGQYFGSADDVRRLVIGTRERQPVYLDDVATVVDGPEQPRHYVSFGSGAAVPGGLARGGFPAVTIAVSKQPGENAVDIAGHVVQRIAQLQGTVIPEGVNVTLTRNYGETANDKAQKLIQKLIFATLSVVALVFVTLGWRRVSLFALIFSIGILVDDAIVVVENIHRRRQLDALPAAESIPRAVDEVGGPTILATLTVIAALLPMAFVSGLMGPYMSPIPINASIGMLISLAIAFVVTPWLALRLLARHAAVHGGEAAEGWLLTLFRRLLTPFLNRAAGRARRYQLLAGIVIAILGSLALAALELVVLKMLPFDNKSEFQIVVDLPAGTVLEQTARVLQEIGAYVATISEVTDYQTYAGTAAPINFNGLVRQYYQRAAPEQGDVQVNLVDKHHRDRKSHEIALAARPQIDAIARRFNARIKVVEVPPGPPVLAPIVAEVYGPDYAGQIAVAQRVREVFGATPDIVDVDDSVEADAPRVVLRVDRNKAGLAGVTQQDVVNTIRIALGGDNVTALRTGSAKYAIPVRLTLPPERGTTLEAVLKLQVRSQDGALIPLSELVQSVATRRERTIYHKDLLPVVYVVGDMAGKLDSPLYGMFAMRSRLSGESSAAGGALEEYFIRQPQTRYAQYAFKWDGEWQVTYETFRDMGIAYAVGLVLIYLLVVAQFKSYLTPLVIMAPIPLTVIGVMPGHAVLGVQFTATSMIGMIALAGIIVRNSILLVDFANQQVAAGMDFQEAIIRSGATRAKPIVLTGLAAMLGALFILDDPIFSGLAVALIFGILVSTLLTLMVIPVLYYAVNWRRMS